jgi:hypothetical protein
MRAAIELAIDLTVKRHKRQEAQRVAGRAREGHGA